MSNFLLFQKSSQITAIMIFHLFMLMVLASTSFTQVVNIDGKLDIAEPIAKNVHAQAESLTALFQTLFSNASTLLKDMVSCKEYLLIWQKISLRTFFTSRMKKELLSVG